MSELDQRLRDARDAQLAAADAAGYGAEDTAWLMVATHAEGVRRTDAARRGAYAGAAATVIGVLAVVLSVARGAASGGQAGGATSNVSVRVAAAGDGTPSAVAPRRCATARGSAPSSSTFDSPDLAFYCSLPSDPAKLDAVLLSYMNDEQTRRTKGPHPAFIAQPGTYSRQNLTFLELGYLRAYVSDPGFPVDRQRDVANLLRTLSAQPNRGVYAHQRGDITSYDAFDIKGLSLTGDAVSPGALAFDGAGRYVGTMRPAAGSSVRVYLSAVLVNGVEHVEVTVRR